MQSRLIFHLFDISELQLKHKHVLCDRNKKMVNYNNNTFKYTQFRHICRGSYLLLILVQVQTYRQRQHNTYLRRQQVHICNLYVLYTRRLYVCVCERMCDRPNNPCQCSMTGVLLVFLRKLPGKYEPLKTATECKVHQVHHSQFCHIIHPSVDRSTSLSLLSTLTLIYFVPVT